MPVAQMTEHVMPANTAHYNEASVRAEVVRIAQRYGGPVLDVGTGACACMAVALARHGLPVTAVDSAISAVYIAQQRAVGDLAALLDVQHTHAAHLPFADGAFRVIVAFDVLCHATRPATVLREMFRVCAHGGAVVVTELNAAGRELTRHLDGGFEKELPGLMAPLCRDCSETQHPFHVTFVCEQA